MTKPQPEENTPDSDVRTHVEILHQLAAGIDGILVVSTFHASTTDDKDRPGTVTHHPVGDIEGMVAAITAHTDTPHANVYVGLQLMRKDLPRGKRGTEADIVAVLGLVADMDGDTGKIGELPIEPNLILETSPGNGQPFWLFDRPLKPAEAKPLAEALKRATGSDNGTADVTHVWRVPGTLNWPNRKKLERGRSPDPVGVTVAQAWAGELTSVEALTDALASWSTTHAEPAPIAMGDLPDVASLKVSPKAARLLAANDVGDRSAHAASVAEQLAFDGHTAEAALALFLSATGDWLARYTTEERAKADFARCWTKHGAKHGEQRAAWSAMAGRVANKPTPKPANDNRPSTAIDAQTLLSMDFPPVAYVVPGAIAEGLTILGGRPKLGKSWLALAVAIAVASGGPVLGQHCDQGDVLYMALEDNRRRLQDRIRTLLPSVKQLRPDLSRLELDTEAPKIDGGLIDRLEAWRLAAANPRMVIIDTLAMVRPAKKKTQDSYEADYAALSPLQKWAGEHRLAVMVVTHVRKMEASDPLEMISGTNGLTGAADSILVLNRDADGPKLYGRGRDIEEMEKALLFDNGRWSVLGDAVEVKRSAERRQVLAALEDALGSMSPADIAKVIGKPKANLNVLLTKMVKDGEIVKVSYGLYAHPGKTGKTD